MVLVEGEAGIGKSRLIQGASGGLGITAPATIRNYYGPLSPSGIRYVSTLGSSGTTGSTWKLFDQPGRSTLDWNEAPAAPGAPTLDPDVSQAQPDMLQGMFFFLETYMRVCADCVQGNTFYPTFYDVTGASPGIGGGPYFYAPGSIHLYNSAGQEIPPDTSLGFATYQLPAQQARYKLVTPTTTWDVTSSEPATDHTPAGTFCAGVFFGRSTAPCQADPLVFLRYDTGLSLANTITPGAHQLRVTGYHQEPSAPPVTSLKLWISTDGGTTWVPAQVTGGHDGAFTATYTVPESAAGDQISIKAQASDTAGNDITQELDDGYTVAQPGKSAR